MFNKIKKFLKHPIIIFMYMSIYGLIQMDDEKFLNLRFKCQMDKNLDLENPKLLMKNFSG